MTEATSRPVCGPQRGAEELLGPSGPRKLVVPSSSITKSSTQRPSWSCSPRHQREAHQHPRPHLGDPRTFDGHSSSGAAKP